MTVSKYCLSGVPEAALRYLLLHELAHLIEANHSRRFWNLVGQFVPDYRKQSKIIQAFHKRAVELDHAKPTKRGEEGNPNSLPQAKPTPTIQPIWNAPVTAAEKQEAIATETPSLWKQIGRWLKGDLNTAPQAAYEFDELEYQDLLEDTDETPWEKANTTKELPQTQLQLFQKK